MSECLARIKHNVECGEVMMRSEHNHPVDENSYQNFLTHAVKVRKFTKKKPKVGSNSDANKTTSSVSSNDSEPVSERGKKKKDKEPEDSEVQEVSDATADED